MARVILSVCFMSMLAFSTQAMPSRAQLSQKTTNEKRIIREEYQPEVLGSREIAESRKEEIRASALDQSLRSLKPRNMRMLVDTGEVDVCGEIFLGLLVYSVLRLHHWIAIYYYWRPFDTTYLASVLRQFRDTLLNTNLPKLPSFLPFYPHFTPQMSLAMRTSIASPRPTP